MRVFELAPLPRSFHLARGAGVVALLLSGVTTTVLFTPAHGVEYTVEEGVLAVDVALGLMDMGRTTPVDAITGIGPIDTRGAWRTSGTGMHDLCHGQWTLADGTDVWMATTCTAPALALEISGESRPWVLTPADPEGLQQALRSGQGGTFPARAGAGEPWFWTLMRLGMPVLLLGVLGVLLRAGRGLRLAVEPSRATLSVSTGWRTTHVALTGATVRHGMTDRGHLVVKALKLGAVQLGRTRSTRGSAEMVVTDADKIVEVVPAQGLPVVVSPAEPDAFLAACVAAGATRA